MARLRAPLVALPGDNSAGGSLSRATMSGMTFEDLPKDVRNTPLTDRRIAADVIDLLIGDGDRRAGCVALMVCDEEHRGIMPIVLSDVPHDADLGALVTLLDLLLPLVVERDGSPRGSRAA